MRKKLLFFPLIIIVFIIFPPTLLLAEETELFSTGIYVITPSDQEVEAEGVATYIFRIDNFNPTPVSLGVKALSSQDWPLLGRTEEITIEPHEKEYIVISVMVPSSVIGGTEDYLELILSTKEKERSFTVKTRVKTIRNLKMEAPNTFRAQAGEDLLIPVTIINNGTLEENYSLTVESENDWMVYWDNPNFSILTPSETETALIRCKVPEFTLPGTVDKLTLHLASDAQKIEQKIKVLVTESKDNINSKTLTIPINSNFNFTYLRPEPDWNLTWRTRGEILPQTKLDLYLHNTNTFKPTNIFMGLTGEEWMLRAGILGHNWNSLIAPPTNSSIFYLQNLQHFPWRLWAGPLSPSSSKPIWWGSNFELPSLNLSFIYLHNAEESGYFKDALTSEYKFFSSPINGWQLSVQGATGFGGEEILYQGGLTANYIMPKWKLLGELKSGRDFYSTNHFNELTFGGSYYALEHLPLESSLTFKTEKHPEEKPIPIWKFQSAVYPDNGSLAFTHTKRLDGVINEIKANKIYYQQKNRFSLSVSMIDENLSKQKKYFLFYGKYRYRFSTENYIESVFEHSITKDNTFYHLPSLGIRWSYSPNNYQWKSYGMFQVNLLPKEPIKLASFQSSLNYKTSADTTLQINLNLSLPNNKPTYYAGLSLYHEDLFLFPTPWCGIHGKAFIDLNRNGKYDHGEPGLVNLPVLLKGKKVSVTGSDGRWEIPLISKGKHLVSLPKKSNEYFAVQSDFEIVTDFNKSVFVSTPYLPPLTIKGVMFQDENDNKLFDPDEQILPGVKILVCNPENELVFETTVEDDGIFFLSLPPGKFLLQIKEDTLPTSTLRPETLELEVGTESPVFILYPILPQKKEIEFFNDPDDANLLLNLLNN